MGHLLNIAIKMQDPDVTTTTTTTAGVITVSWSYSVATCTGDSFTITKNAVTVVGPISASGSGTFTAVVGDALVVTTTSGIKGIGCDDAYSEILRNGVTIVASQTSLGFSATAIASWTVTSGTTSISCTGFVGAV
jgi:hypothetical protein